MRTSLRFGLVAALAAIASSSMAIEIWATDNLGANNAQTIGDRIIKFDSANPTGTVVTVGATGVNGVLMGGLAFDGAGTLYAAGQVASAGNLYTINQSTGAATLVGAMTPTAGHSIVDLSWNSATNTMLALGGNGTGTGSVSSLYSVNLGTGATTLLGNISGLPASHLVIGLASDAAGNNYVHDIITDAMYKLTGLTAAAMSGTIGFDTNFSQGMTIDAASNRWFLGNIGGASPFTSQVREMNLATGATSSILATWPANANTLPEYETGDLAIRPVPEPATLAALGLGLAALARRRRKA